MTEIFSRAALAQRSLPELRILFRKAQDELALCKPGSRAHFEHAANLLNVRREIAFRTNPAPRS